MVGRLLRRLGGNGNVQVSADYASNFLTGYALVGDTVITRAGGRFLEHELVEMSNIEPVDCRSALYADTPFSRAMLITDVARSRDRPLRELTAAGAALRHARHALPRRAPPLELGSLKIFAKMLDGRSSWNQQDVGRALQKPGKRKLQGRGLH